MRNIVAGLLLLPSTAYAEYFYDAEVETKTGGLRYISHPSLNVEELEIVISLSEIKARYIFANKSDKDIDSFVTFPMPELARDYRMSLKEDDLNANDFLKFKAFQENKSVNVKLEHKATVLGLDITEELKSKNIPLMPRGEKVKQSVNQLPNATKSDWVTRGILDKDAFDFVEGARKDVLPGWYLQSTYWWKAHFPANSKVQIQYEYVPSVGSTVNSGLIDDIQNLDRNEDPHGDTLDFKQRYCLSSEAFDKLASNLKAADYDPIYHENWISYDLIREVHGHQPIKKFKLVIDKGDPENIVSFCGQGTIKETKDTLEMTIENFDPSQDVEIVFLEKTEVIHQ